MTKIAPKCALEPFKSFEATIKSFDGEWQLRDSIADNNDKHYLLIKVPTNYTNPNTSVIEESNKILILGIQRSGSNLVEFMNLDIKDSCGNARIEGETIRFLTSYELLVTGWFVASESVCIGDNQIYPSPQFNSSTGANSTNYLEETKVPFLAKISTSTGKINSVYVPTDLIGWSIQSLDIDYYTGKMYVLAQNETQINLITLYRDQVILNTQIATCNVLMCQSMTVHFSALYERVIISLFEKQPLQLTVNNDNQAYSNYYSALWVVLLNKDGSYIHNHRIFHTVANYTISSPSIKFDTIGKLNILLTCERNCYLNGEIVSPNVFLLQYDYIKTSFSFVKNFIQTSSGSLSFKVHSLLLERDLTINAIISSNNSVSYLIKDGINRSFQAIEGIAYQYRFRHSDAKIIHVQQLYPSNSTNEIRPSLSSSIVNSFNFVNEFNSIIYSTNKELKVQVYSNYGLIPSQYFTTISISSKFGGDGGNPYLNAKTTKAMHSIFFFTDTYYRSSIVKCIVVTYYDGDKIYFNNNNYDCTGSGDMITFDTDEYWKEMHHDTYTGGVTVLSCVKIVTNKRSFMVNSGCDGHNIAKVPQGLDVVGLIVNAGVYVDSITYAYGYTYTYSCASGYSGDDCQAPSCYDVDARVGSVCSGNGKCIGPNNCSSCSSTGPFDAHNCLSYGFCNNIASYKLDVCSGHGSCDYTGKCQCEMGYFGNSCEIESKCFGIPKSNYGTCSNHGYCLETDTCECNIGYTGKNCELPICYGKSSNTTGVCSGHGDCLRPSVCSCKTGYYGSKCQYFYCNGTIGSSPSACSGNGKCVDYNTCVCSGEYFGSNCELFNCSGVVYSDPKVCSSNGKCNGINNCTCTNPGSYGANCEKCVDGYYGDHCEKWTCNGIPSTSPNVCNSRGTCQSLNKCVCDYPSIKGLFCSSCEIGYFGAKCNNWTCDGVLNSNSSVCNFRGVCSAYNKCECNTRSNGTYCDKCIGYYDGQSCGSCVGSHFGDECFNFLESNKATYIESLATNVYHDLWYQKQGYYNGNLYGFRIITNTNFRYVSDSIDCSILFQNLNEIVKPGSRMICTVAEVGLNIDKKSYRYTIDLYTPNTPNNGVLFNPRIPIKFNVMWSSGKDASYDIVNLDVSDFLKKQQPTFTGLSIQVSNSIMNSNTINRCFESKITAIYSQIDPGAYQSLKWELVGNSIGLMNNSLVREALAQAQNNLVFTLPYVPEILRYKSVDISAKIVTNFGLTFTKTATFALGGSYSRTSNYFTRSIIVVTSTEVILPLSKYYTENLECVDGRTISYSYYKSPSIPWQLFLIGIY